ncbi:MAG: hypothetical protein ABEI77_05160 [Halorientalis sp.]
MRIDTMCHHVDDAYADWYTAREFADEDDGTDGEAAAEPPEVDIEKPGIGRKPGIEDVTIEQPELDD